MRDLLRVGVDLRNGQRQGAALKVFEACTLAEASKQPCMVTDALRACFEAQAADSMEDEGSTRHTIKKTLFKICRLHWSLYKLTRPVNASTAPVGNGDILSAAMRLGRRLKLSVEAHTLMSKKQARKSTLILNIRDTPSTRAKQWARLRKEVRRLDTALIFHLKNHYACIFGVREYFVTADAPPVLTSPPSSTDGTPTTSPPLSRPPSAESASLSALASELADEDDDDDDGDGDGDAADGVRAEETEESEDEDVEAEVGASDLGSGVGNKGLMRREVLTGRKGQKPKHWISWEEIHHTIANSTTGTYCLMRIQAK